MHHQCPRAIVCVNVSSWLRNQVSTQTYNLGQLGHAEVRNLKGTKEEQDKERKREGFSPTGFQNNSSKPNWISTGPTSVRAATKIPRVMRAQKQCWL